MRLLRFDSEISFGICSRDEEEFSSPPRRWHLKKANSRIEVVANWTIFEPLPQFPELQQEGNFR
jgi:hypothetical protein